MVLKSWRLGGDFCNGPKETNPKTISNLKDLKPYYRMQNDIVIIETKLKHKKLDTKYRVFYE
jgi:hypothetical protein